MYKKPLLWTVASCALSLAVGVILPSPASALPTARTHRQVPGKPHLVATVENGTIVSITTLLRPNKRLRGAMKSTLFSTVTHPVARSPDGQTWKVGSPTGGHYFDPSSNNVAKISLGTNGRTSHPPAQSKVPLAELFQEGGLPALVKHLETTF